MIPVFLLPKGYEARFMRLTLQPAEPFKGQRRWRFYGRSDDGYSVPARYGAAKSFIAWPTFATREEACTFAHAFKVPPYAVFNARRKKPGYEPDAFENAYRRIARERPGLPLIGVYVSHQGEPFVCMAHESNSGPASVERMQDAARTYLAIEGNDTVDIREFDGEGAERLITTMRKEG